MDIFDKIEYDDYKQSHNSSSDTINPSLNI